MHKLILIILSLSPQTGDLGALRTYYISLLVNNNLGINIDIRIRLNNGTEQTRTVASKATMVTDFLIQSRYQPDDAGVYGVLSGTTDIVYLNGKPELSIQPTIARNTFTINTEGDSGMISMFNFYIIITIEIACEQLN